MELVQLADGLAEARLRGDPGLLITHIAYHTRDVSDGTLFLCVPGTASDGHAFAPQAVQAGAVALVCERELDLPVAQLIVSSVRAAMPRIAALFYGHPSRELTVAGVTGTNGKTTTAHLLAAVFGAAGLPSGLLGTVGNRVGGREVPYTLTTPEAPDLQRLLRAMLAAGDKACAMEVSSHALVMGRAAEIEFALAAFTNLTREHLDFHRDIDEYYGAKRLLFLPGAGPRPRLAVVNIGDQWGARLAAECAETYGRDLWSCRVEGAEDGAAGDAGSGGAGGADALAVDLTLEPAGSQFTLHVPRLGLEHRMRLRLAARFNVENALVAATAALALDLSLEAVAEALAGVVGVPGRFEAVRAGQPFSVLVDYSHTPDSLENAILAAHAVAKGRVAAVFGCGGDRDRGKRPLMGAIAARHADLAVVTSDNPRSEDPDAIIAEILAGVPDGERRHVAVEPDRRAAIALALEQARAGDVVVIAGKGHEQGQLIAGRKIPFDDRKVALELLAQLGWEAAE